MKLVHLIGCIFALFTPPTFGQVNLSDSCSVSVAKLGTSLYSQIAIMHKDVEKVQKEVSLVDRSVQIVETKLSVVKDKVDAGFAAVTNNGKTIEGELSVLKNTIKTGLQDVEKNMETDLGVVKKTLEALQKSVGNMEVRYL